ncbi:hypothetical protein ACQP1G_37695 [Nocardia sp. CA-107356]|uniref:hypothetical protein n=1 Tax=Nocardia sp. CA-107356 TaxID=3239972 RepID=UPI003D8A28AC
MTSTAFYLLKPDALTCGTVAQRARELAPNLHVVAEQDVVITSQQVSALWADNRSELYPIASAFLKLYLVGQTSRLVTVHGETALEDVIGLKQQLRREYGRGAFANVVHAPSDPRENEDHAAVLEGRSRPPRSGPVYPPASSRVVSLGQDEIFHVVSAIWKQAHEFGWPSLAAPPSNAPAAVWLIADHVHSIDSAVSALWEGLPQLSLHTAVALVCEVERTGRTPVLSGTPAVVAHAARRLRALGLQIETGPSTAG